MLPGVAREGPISSNIEKNGALRGRVTAWRKLVPMGGHDKAPPSLTGLTFNYCFGVEPFVERLLSFLVLSAEPGISWDVPILPVVPVELPFASDFIAPLSERISALGFVGGVG